MFTSTRDGNPEIYLINPDGSANKYKRPLKDFPRTGHIGLQDHHYDVWFKNIRVKPLAGEKGRTDAGAK